MKKDNVMKSSEFFMDVGDILVLRFLDETGVVPDIILNVRNEDGTTNQEEAPDAPTALSASDITDTSFTANWSYSENTLGFYLDVARDSAFISMVAGYNNLDVGLVSEYNIIGLIDGCVYYYRLRGYNDYGISVNSNIITLSTTVDIVTDGDGNIYTYVTIGTQQWLIENLHTTHYIDGVAIPNLILDAQWLAEDGTPGHDGAYCWYNNDAVAYADYGCLYNWYAISNAHGLAPTGWRIPTEADYLALRTASGGLGVAGGKLKELGTTYWNSPNTDADNYYGFSGRGAGQRNYFTGVFSENKERLYLSSTLGHLFTSYYNSPTLQELGLPYRTGISVRCMRDV